MTIDLWSFDDGWMTVRWRSSRNDHPAVDELIALVRERGVPPDLGSYVASRLTRKQGRGRPPKNSEGDRKERAARALDLRYQVLRRHAELLLIERKARASVAQLAVEDVANAQLPRRLSPDRVRDIIRRDGRLARRYWPGQWPTLAIALAVVREELREAKQRTG